ncbi:MAG: YtxH domain-containing protein [Dehalococcoidia bacterium]
MRFFFGFAFGLTLGAFIALVLAPQPGSQTRRLLAEQARQRADQARQRFARHEEGQGEQQGAGVAGAGWQQG